MYKFIISRLDVRGKLTLCFLVGFSCLSGLLSIVSPIISGRFIDDLLSYRQFSTIISFCMLLVGLCVVNLCMGYSLQLAGIRMTAKIGYGMSLDIIDYYGRLEIPLKDGQSIAYLSQRINADTNQVIGFVLNSIPNIVVKILMVVFISWIMLQHNGSMLVVIAFFVMIYSMTYLSVRNRIYLMGKVLKEASNMLFGGLTERLSKTKFIRIHNVQSRFTAKLDELYNDFLHKKISYQKLSFKFGSVDTVLSTFSQVAIFVIGGSALIRGEITIGYFTVIVAYTNMLLGQVKFFLSFGKTYQESKVSYERLMEIFGRPLSPQGNSLLNTVKKIEVKNLKFGYEDINVLEEVSVSFKRGHIYCVLGENGAGKSTFCDLLLGLYSQRYKGEILFDKIELKQLNMENHRTRCIGISEQEPTIMTASIRENLLLNSPDAMDSEHLNELVQKLLERLNLITFVLQNGMGLDTIIGEENMNLSGGERQKIALIRLFIQDPAVFIFDEPTAALDPDSIRAFCDELLRIKKDRIIICVTHDPILCAIADETLCLDKLR